MSDDGAGTAAAAAHLSVMSYNVRFDNPPVDPFTWRERRDDVASVVRFHAPDVVGLQEALHDQLDDLRERLPGYEWLSAGRAAARNAGEYAAVGYDADRFERVDDDTFWLSETPEEPGSVGWDAAFPRLVRCVRLRERATGAELVHFNTHFDHEGETARLRSAELLRERVRERAPETPVVVTGDLNCVEGDVPYRHLLGTESENTEPTLSLRDCHYAAETPHHGPLTTRTEFDDLVPERKIDHVLASEELVVTSHAVCADTTADGRYPSDHLPIVADLAVPVSDRAATPSTTRGAGSPVGE